MRHLTLFFVLSLFAVFTSLAQTGSVQGIVIDVETVKPIQDILVQLEGSDININTNNKGEFLLNNIPVGMGKLILTSDNYKTKELEFSLEEGQLLQIGSITMKIGYEVEEVSEDMPIIELEDSEVDGENSNSQSGGGLLHSSGDLFSSTAAYTFGSARFRVRGYDQENSNIFFNGILMNNMETGRPSWSDWGGLNDAVRNKEIVYAGDNSDVSLTSLGGSANIITRASEYRPGVKVSYMSTNRNYRNRVMATASTGLMDNNFAVTISGSHRWAEEGYVEGTTYDAWAYFLTVEKVINKKHSVSLTAFAAPNKRGKQIGSSQEAYDEEDNNYYNANWGYQNGEKRNSRVANSQKPFISLIHNWDFSEKLKINTAVAYSFGRSGATALNWYDAKDPRPNYYKYLPYYNRDDEGYSWDNRQVDWDFFYFANEKNLYTLQDVDGVDGKDVTFMRSKYMVEDRRIDHDQIRANVSVVYDLNEDLAISGNVNYSWYKGRHFKLVDDLLGGDYFVDIDHFAERDFSNPELAQSDLNNPNRLTKEGDVFGYDYDANIEKIGGFVKADYSLGNIDFYLGTELSNTSFSRTGNMRNGKFPEDSYGDSEKQTFFNYDISLGVNYKITGRHIVYGNAKYMTRAPYFDNAYVSPRTRDHLVNGLTSETITSIDLNYVVRLPYLVGRVSGYYSKFEDQTDVKSYFDDGAHGFINYVMTGIDKKHLGIEVGLEGKITSELSLNAVAAIGQYTYDSRPELAITVDNGQGQDYNLPQDKVVYIKDFRVPGTPQQAYSLGLKYNSPKFWWVELSGNYFDDIYLDFHPGRRVESVIGSLDPTTPYGADKIEEITAQEKLPGQFTVNLSGGKSWKIGDYIVRVHAQVNNILNNQKFITGGYEQMRFDYAEQDLNKFSPVYFYSYGTNYMLILTFQL
jgi:hypothetical protein